MQVSETVSFGEDVIDRLQGLIPAEQHKHYEIRVHIAALLRAMTLVVELHGIDFELKRWKLKWLVRSHARFELHKFTSQSATLPLYVCITLLTGFGTSIVLGLLLTRAQ